MVERTGVVQVHAACVEVHAQLPTIESPVCGLRLCISSLLQPTKRLRVSTGAPPSAGPPRPNTPSGKRQQHGGLLQNRRKTTVVHKAAILNSLTGLYQEPNKRDSKCDTVHFVCASAKSVAPCMIKSDRGRLVPT